MTVPPQDSDATQSSTGYVDGLGRRELAFDRETGGMLERLVLRPEFAVFEQALNERMAIVTGLEDERFARPRAIERLDDRLVVISEFLAGRRLSDIIEAAAEHGIVAGLDAGLGLLLELLPAIARIHDAGLAHGSISPGRIMVSPGGQIVLLDSIYADPLERLKLTRKRLWAELRLAFPPTAGMARFDKAADLGHAAMVAATLTVGRTLQDDDYPEGIAILRQEILEIASIRGSKGFAEAVDKFFASTLPVAGRRITPSADEAAIDLRKLVRKELGINTCRTALVEFLQQVETADAERMAAEAAARDEAMAQAAEQVRVDADRKQKQDADGARQEQERTEQARREAERAEAARREAARAESARLEAERAEHARREAERVERERAEQARLEAERVERERAEEARLEAERVERERAEKARLEAERVERERAEQARLEAERAENVRLERERVERERAEQARLEAERLERERLEAERRERERLEAERLEAERRERERLEAERLEAERRERERLEAERLEAERRERERLEAERLEAERRERERLEAERRERERLEAERLERERLERERLEAERRERERLEAERLERERLEAERRERERLEAERLEAERRERERLEAERRERERLEAERLERERLEAERRERERLEAERLERERLEAERRERERLEAERLEAERLERERAEHARREAERAENARLERERIERERAEHARIEAERIERERLEAERRERERLEAERLERERLERERLERERAEKARLEAERIERERLERERQEAERVAQEARQKAERLERERLEAARQAEQARLEAERLEQQRADAERRQRQQTEPDREPLVPAEPARSAGGWLIPPRRATTFDPPVDDAPPAPLAPPPAAAERPYPIYVPPAEPAAWNADIPAAETPASDFLAPIADARPVAAPTPIPLQSAPTGPAPIKLKIAGGDEPYVPARSGSRLEPIQMGDDNVSAEGAYEHRQSRQEKPPIPWRLIAAGVVAIAGAYAISRGYVPSAAPVVDTVRRVVPKAAISPAAAPVAPNVGRLIITTQPAGAKVTIDGKAAGETPLTVDNVKPGRRVIALAGAEGSARRTVRVDGGQIVTIDVPLYSGFAAISIPFVVSVSEGGKVIGTSENPILLSPGRHTLRLVNKELAYSESHTIEIQSGETSRLDLDPHARANINAAPWAEVWIDGEKAGDTPLANVQIRLGIREIVFKNPQFPERKQSVTITAGPPATISVDFLK